MQDLFFPLSCSIGTLSYGMGSVLTIRIKPGPLHWEYRVLTTGPPGTFPSFAVLPIQLREFMVHHFSYSFAEAPDHLPTNFVPAVQQVFTLNDPILRLFQACP